MKLEQEILNEIIQQAQDLMSNWNAGRNMQKRFIIEWLGCQNLTGFLSFFDIKPIPSVFSGIIRVS